jgi:hypothetical protein
MHAAVPQTAPAAQNMQAVGAIKSINGTTIIMAPDGAADLRVEVQLSTQIVRVAPGQTDLKTAPPIKLTDLQVGDRILVRGKLSDDKKSLVASGVMAMKRSDVEAKQAQEREDWQKRGIGGLVKDKDAANGTLTISVAAPGGPKPLTLHIAKSTVLRRYAPDSVRFDDATPGTLAQIRPGDQLRARGTRSTDGNDFAAEEVVSGSFRNISGTINTIDATMGKLTVNDLTTKKPVTVKVTAKSQVYKLPAAVAQGLAARMKGGAGAAPTDASAGAARPGGEQRAAGPGTAGGPGGGRPGGAQADLQQIVSRMSPTPLSDLQKGDAVMIVSTQSGDATDVTAITLLGGVEPILTASPQAGESMTLSPWSLGGGGGDGE